MIEYPKDLPCWAPGAADYLASILTGEEIAWEWGGGQSTAWLVDKVAYLHTMEHDPAWAGFILDKVGCPRDDFKLYLEAFESFDRYVNVVKSVDPRPTLWLIDGYRRVDCFAVMMHLVQQGDIVVCDDAMDYALKLLTRDRNLMRFAMPHPHAGKKIARWRIRKHRNTKRCVHSMTKETWVWQV